MWWRNYSKRENMNNKHTRLVELAIELFVRMKIYHQ